jgi:outer membrane protein
MNSQMVMIFTLAVLPSLGYAEEITLTLKDALQRASQNSSEVLLSKIGTQVAAAKTRSERASLLPRLNVGSGLAATYGFPLSIEGSAPSILEVNFVQPLFNQTARKQVEAARLDEEGAQSLVQDKALDSALRAGELFVELRNRRQKQGYFQAGLESLKKVRDIIQTRVEAGVVEPRELTQARLEVARAGLALASNQEATMLLEERLKQIIFLPAETSVILGEDDVPGDSGLLRESDSILSALESDPSLMQLRLQKRSYEVAEMALPKPGRPTVNLVGSYGLFSKFNNYDLYFKQFQRNNALLGFSIQVPLFTPESGPEQRRLQAARDEIDVRIRMRSDQLRLEARRELANQETLQAKEEVASLEAQLARENLQTAQARYDQGRASLVELEQARRAEGSRWIEYLDVKLEKEKSRLKLSRQTGSLLQSVR